MEELAVGGDSEAWNALKANALRLHEEWRVHDPAVQAAYPEPFATLPEEDKCSQPMYGRFANWLLHTYRIPNGAKNAGQHLGVDTVLKNLAIIINLAADEYKATGTDASKLFFTSRSR